MRVFLGAFLFLFINTTSMAASSCHQQVLEKMTSELHSYIKSSVNVEDFADSQKDFYKKIGFQSIGTDSGVKLILNVDIKDLEKSSSAEEFKVFNDVLNNFFAKNKRVGTIANSDGFYPKDDVLPCFDQSLFLSQHKQCLNGLDTLDSSQIDALGLAIKSIFDATSIRLVEVDKSSFTKDKVINVITSMKLENLSGLNLDGDTKGCAISGMLIKCSFSEFGKKSISLQGPSSFASIELEYLDGSTYLLSDELGNNTYNVIKKSPENPKGKAIEDFTIVQGAKNCSKDGVNISCTNLNEMFVLKVNPEKKEDEQLSLEIRPSNAFYIQGDDTKDPLYSYLQPVLIKDSKEVSVEEGKVNFIDLKTCEVISRSRNIIKCPKLDEPYNIEAQLVEESSTSKADYTVVAKGQLGQLSLEITPYQTDSLQQIDTIKVMASGVAISANSFSKLGITLKYDQDIRYDMNNSFFSSKRKEKDYSYIVELYENGTFKSKQQVNVAKYVADNSFFFNTISKDRYCRFSLMKVLDVGNYVDVGSSSYISEMFETKVSPSKGVSCSGVQKNSNSTQIMCTISKDKFSGSVKVDLLSNGSVVRSANCNLTNSEYDFEREDDDKFPGDDEDREFRGKTIKRSTASSKALADSATDAFSALLPEYLKSRYPTSNTQYYNPLMYQPYYYGGPMLPSSYGNIPGMWDTSYIFNPATY
ncbi:hypothetical protein [Halobacteriovorax sp. HLS]|uniref:hypothetical protein n=1 Tax=Halobacteriovorax sp. HLS TaxID=2234000 RepID=UPI000FDA438B|nr:hypothetical protein [Halobacteriovorax sp. HLS]